MTDNNDNNKVEEPKKNETGKKEPEQVKTDSPNKWDKAFNIIRKYTAWVTYLLWFISFVGGLYFVINLIKEIFDEMIEIYQATPNVHILTIIAMFFMVILGLTIVLFLAVRFLVKQDIKYKLANINNKNDNK